jgi:type II secretory pathway component GspD/PulD (secretin)
MTRRSRFLLPALLATSLLSSPGGDAAAEGPAAPPLGTVDLDLRGAPVRDVLGMLAQATARTASVDPCVRGAVDVRLQNTPPQLVLDALASKFGLVYEDRDGTMEVHCSPARAAGAAGDPAVRLSLDERDAALPEVAARVAAAAHLSGVDYRATSRPRVNVRLERVRLPTALAALADSTGLRVRVSEGRLVVAD